MSKQAKHFYDFDRFRVDLVRRVLLREGQPVPITPKVFDTLLALVESSGRVIERDELIRKVWAETIVEEGGLTRNISVLRKALGECPEDHQYIVTIPGRGYRFVAKVDEVPDDQADLIVEEHSRALIVVEQEEETIVAHRYEAAEQTIAKTALKSITHEEKELKRRTMRIAAALVATLVLLISLVVGVDHWFSRRAKAPMSFEETQVKKLRHKAEVVVGAISDDGKLVAHYEWDDLWVEQVVTGGVIQIPHPSGTTCWGLAFSRDSNYVYYSGGSPTTKEGSIYQLPIFGGPQRKLVSNIAGFKFSPDGQRMAFKRYHALPGRHALIVASADGSGEQIITTRPATTHSIWSFDWLPDGQTIVCIYRDEGADTVSWSVVAVPVGGGPERTILANSRRPIKGVFWWPNTGGFLLTALDEISGALQLWHLSYPDGALRRITHDSNNYIALGVTADGRTILALSGDQLSNVWTAPLNDVRRAKPVTSSAGSYDAAVWTPDGRIVYTARANGKTDLWIMDADGLQRKQLTFEAAKANYPAVSADGRFIVFASDRSGRSNIWRVEIDGSNPTQLTSDGGTLPQCSPDNQWVVYEVDVLDKWHLWKVPLQGGTPVPVADEHLQAADPAISPDGRMLAYECLDQGANGFRLAVRSWSSFSAVKEFDEGLAWPPIRWSRDERNLIYFGNAKEMRLQPLAGGPAQRLLTAPANDIFFSFDLSRDGKFIVFTSGILTSDLVLFSGSR